MYKNRKITFVAFASLDLRLSAERIKAQALASKYYDEIKIFDSDDFDDQMKETYKNLKISQKKRGYGYWFWKPIILLKVMKEIEPGSIIHYADIGCHIQNKNKRFYEYLDILIKNKNWLLPFQYHFENINNINEIIFQQREEYKYTKADLLDYFGCLNDKRITHSPQFWSGTFFMTKCNEAEMFLKKWDDVWKKKFELVDDSESKLNNFDGFIENRHDQSIFSILCKKESIKSLSAYECEWGEKNSKRTWDHNQNNPILAKRDKKYNFFKRFINRQARNLNRYKNRLLD